jgi:hypothetical protein
MKKVLAITLFLISVSAFAQEKKKIMFGINSAVSFHEKWSQDAIYNFSVTADFGKHFVYSGILLSDNGEFIRRNDDKVPGLQLGYQFYPFKQKKYLNPFLEYDLNLASSSGSGEGKVYDNWNCSYMKTTRRGTSLMQCISIGARLNLSEDFYLHTSVGGGLIWYSYYEKDICSNGHIDEYDYPLKLGSYPFSLYLKAGLGINIFKIKK